MSTVTELKPGPTMNDRYPTVRIRRNDNHANYGEPGTFSIEGFVIGTRIMKLSSRSLVTVDVGAGSVTLQVPNEDVEVIS